jgi:hypothetical protein
MPAKAPWYFDKSNSMTLSVSVFRTDTQVKVSISLREAKLYQQSTLKTWPLYTFHNGL